MKALVSKSSAEARLLAAQLSRFQAFIISARLPIPSEAGAMISFPSIFDVEVHYESFSDMKSMLLQTAAQKILSLARRVYEHPGLIINPTTHMAWRPYENLINGELDNQTPGRVTGWLRFYRFGKRPLRVKLDLVGDFHDDIRGKVIRLSNPDPVDRNESLDREGTYMEGFASMQRGDAGDITAGLPLGIWSEDLSQKLLQQQELIWEENGLPAVEREQRWQEIAQTHRPHIERKEPFYPYAAYPYIEWYSEANGRVVLELEPEQVEIVGSELRPPRESAPRAGV
jgi:hypothetical protein